jgi:hypothetical protein
MQIKRTFPHASELCECASVSEPLTVGSGAQRRRLAHRQAHRCPRPCPEGLQASCVDPRTCPYTLRTWLLLSSQLFAQPIARHPSCGGGTVIVIILCCRVQGQGRTRRRTAKHLECTCDVIYLPSKDMITEQRENMLISCKKARASSNTLCTAAHQDWLDSMLLHC